MSPLARFGIVGVLMSINGCNDPDSVPRRAAGDVEPMVVRWMECNDCRGGEIWIRSWLWANPPSPCSPNSSGKGLRLNAWTPSRPVSTAPITAAVPGTRYRRMNSRPRTVAVSGSDIRSGRHGHSVVSEESPRRSHCARFPTTRSRRRYTMRFVARWTNNVAVERPCRHDAPHRGCVAGDARWPLRDPGGAGPRGDRPSLPGGRPEARAPGGHQGAPTRAGQVRRDRTVPSGDPHRGPVAASPHRSTPRLGRGGRGPVLRDAVCRGGDRCGAGCFGSVNFPYQRAVAIAQDIR